jgi:hypothetical protein
MNKQEMKFMIELVASLLREFPEEAQERNYLFFYQAVCEEFDFPGPCVNDVKFALRACGKPM